jgi:chorismate synthase
MSGNIFGRVFRVVTWGESHGVAVGAVVDGCPSNLPLSEEDIQVELNRRRPGQSEVTSKRMEKDRVTILSGVFEGKTTGTPISMIVWNRDVDSSPYEKFRYVPRPGHADLTYFLKFGHRDHRGGGRSSGRETVGRVCAGAIAKKLLSLFGIKIRGHVVRIGNVISEASPERVFSYKENSVRCVDERAAREMEKLIKEVAETGDSIGGIVEILASGIPPGLGEPVFDKLDADIAKAMMSIGAVKGVEIGMGFKSAEMRGSEMNDEMRFKDGRIVFTSNNAGGVLGGISTGELLKVRIAVKPTPSISKSQKTVDLREQKDVEISIKGRHDPSIVPRIVPVAEAMLGIVLADHMMLSGFIPRRL